MTEREQRMMPVPDGLAGMRVDGGPSKLRGLSLSVVADLAAAGDSTAEGKALGNAARPGAGQRLDVTLTAPGRGLAAEPPRVVVGMDSLYSDDDVIAVNRPVGVAARPTLGWEGPSVTAGLAAAGFRISTSGPPERKGIVQRLDVGTSGVMIVAASERA